MQRLILVTAAWCALSGCKAWGEEQRDPETRCLGEAIVQDSTAGAPSQYLLRCPKVECREPNPGASSLKCQPVDGTCACQGKDSSGKSITKNVVDCHLKLADQVVGNFKPEEQPYLKASCEGECVDQTGKPTGKTCKPNNYEASIAITAPDGTVSEAKRKMLRCQCQ